MQTNTELNDLMIDRILSEFKKGDERVSMVLERLKVEAPRKGNWPVELRDHGIFEIIGAPDYIELTPHGKSIQKAAAGKIS